MTKKKNTVFIILALFIMIILGVGICFLKKQEDIKPQKNNPAVTLNSEFNMDIIKIVNSKESGNYLISPYSIELALNMLKEGASAETYNQINKVVSKRNITTFDVKDRISVANAVFVKNSKKNDINKKYINKLQTFYKADLVFDDFVKPDKINNWVNEKTYGMVPKILNSMDSNFVLGLANAIAIDVEWANQFECVYTYGDDFTTDAGIEKVEMMSNNYRKGTYILNEEEQGIFLPYNSYTNFGEIDYDNKEDSTALEFIAIMPMKTDIKDYINTLTNDKLNSILNSSKQIKDNQKLNLKLPRFEYDYEDSHFKADLNDLGIKDAFVSELADFSKMKDPTSSEKFYVGTAIHKTHISLNEKGTKAAAVTFFGMDAAESIEKKVEYITIEFNKPFMYMIRDTKTKEMLFFGVVETPNTWNGSTCSKQ